MDSEVGGEIRVHVLGAGSEVGRSCFLLSMGGVNVVIDAGVHMNPSDPLERIPNIPKDVRVDAVIITHYHLDHIGALPHLTEVINAIPKECPIYMTWPTRLMASSLMIDYCKGPANTDLYVPNHVWNSLWSDRVKMIGRGEEFRIRSTGDGQQIGGEGVVVNNMYAGHVIGGVLLIFRSRMTSVVYTGDFSVVKDDSLLDPVCVDTDLLPAGGVDVVISECTHATTVTPVNKSLGSIEQEMCVNISRCLTRGGSVLIPVFAVGRTQELVAVVRKYLGSDVSVYTTSPAAKRACWLTSSVLSEWTKGEYLDGQHEAVGMGIKVLGEDEPMPASSIVFAGPAMIEGGASLRLFLESCQDGRNLVVLTGYCSKDTVGNSVILFASRNMRDKSVNVHGRTVSVECECKYFPMTNHADSNGIAEVITKLRPKKGLILVHGQRDKMERFAHRIRGELNPSCRIDIPRNYDVCSYELSGHTTDAPDAMTDAYIARIDQPSVESTTNQAPPPPSGEGSDDHFSISECSD